MHGSNSLCYSPVFHQQLQPLPSHAGHNIYRSYKDRFRPLIDGTIRRWKEGKRHNAHLKVNSTGKDAWGPVFISTFNSTSERSSARLNKEEGYCPCRDSDLELTLKGLKEPLSPNLGSQLFPKKLTLPPPLHSSIIIDCFYGNA
ncbi:unnamed protein product [Microthlaspi erraticum]|uniref:Uncharacterized protein n=1 Tax=Microthlaspi erraticum TaxID=1685480 RepID=A0A6D2I417_9BRAS|nr:unnamed protein product [Microthlaspi erraticum]